MDTRRSAAGRVSTCFISTLRAKAEVSKLDFDSVELPIHSTIEKLEGGFRFTRIALRPVLTMQREEDWERAGRMLEKAERICLVSGSLNCTILLEPKILVAARAGSTS